MVRKTPGSRVAVALVLLVALAACARGPSYVPLDTEAVVLAFGDSVTYGTGAGGGAPYPELLGLATGWQVINAGVPGDTAREARDRIAPLLEKHHPALVLVELGGNDFLRKRPDDKVKEDLRHIVQAIRGTGAIPVLVAVPHLSVLRATTGTLSDADIYSELAEEEQVHLIANIFSDILSEDSLRADPIHPNARGYEQLAEGIADGLRAAGLLL